MWPQKLLLDASILVTWISSLQRTKQNYGLRYYVLVYYRLHISTHHPIRQWTTLDCGGRVLLSCSTGWTIVQRTCIFSASVVSTTHQQNWDRPATKMTSLKTRTFRHAGLVNFEGKCMSLICSRYDRQTRWQKLCCIVWVGLHWTERRKAMNW